MRGKTSESAERRRRADADNPEWIEADFAAARPAAELHPDLVAAAQLRGPQKGPAKAK